MLRWFLLGITETASSWLMTALAAERFFALYFPLRHHTLFSKHTTKWLLLAVGVVALVVTFPSIFYAKVLSSPLSGTDSCVANFAGQTLVGLVIYLAIPGLNSHLVPMAADIVFTILIVAKLIHVQVAHSSGHRALQGSSSSDTVSAQSSRLQLATCATIVIISLMELLVYIPFSMSYIVMLILELILAPTDPLVAMFQTLSFLLFSITTVKRSVNLYILLLRVPALRRRLCCRRGTNSSWILYVWHLYCNSVNFLIV